MSLDTYARAATVFVSVPYQQTSCLAPPPIPLCAQAQFTFGLPCWPNFFCVLEPQH